MLKYSENELSLKLALILKTKGHRVEILTEGVVEVWDARDLITYIDASNNYQKINDLNKCLKEDT